MFGRLSSLFTAEGIYSLLCSLPAIIIALSFHEFAHAFAAYKMGDPTARNLGRLTLNPLNHLDPIGTIMIVVAGFGWAKPVPVSTRNYRNYKVGVAVVSLAGVTMNLLLAFVSAGLMVFGVGVLGITSDVFLNIMNALVIINLSLMFFNLIPVPPLDGSHVFRLALARVLPAKFFYYYERYGNLVLLALLLTGAVSMVFGSLIMNIYMAFIDFFSLFM